MIMPDVNILVYAHRQDEATHKAYKAWLEKIVAGPQPFALSVLVADGFVRVVTNPKIFPTPTPLPIALAAVDQLAASPLCRWVAPDTNHFADVAGLCRAVRATGKLVADAQHAALAIAEGCTFVTRDADFARFARHGLTWTHLTL
jgi:toxin-antitoxin system PIN domain toxin